MFDEIANRVNSLLIEEFEVDPDVISPDAELKGTLDLDSLDYIDLIALTESNFGCKVKPEDFYNLKTFGDFYNYIASHTKKTETI